ncbi:MAG: hypothetical protein ACRDV1_07585, partial [Actinomycetes bacterium]
MAGRHRKPTAWRRLLMSLSTSRHDAQVAALQAELRTLRATITELRGELAEARATAAASAVTRVPVT